MSEVDLNRIDLNLLVALDVLLEEQHVSKSAIRLGLSQPAMSRTLSRLRDAFDDPLIVRAQGGYAPTARAEALAANLKVALSEVRGVFADPEFEPATANDTFRLSTLDYSELVVFPELFSRIRAAAPEVQIEVLQRTIFSIEEILDGIADISIGLMPASLPKHCVTEPLLKDDYVCVMHKNHPIANDQLTLGNYLKHPHSIIHTGKAPGSYVDDSLAELGHERRIVKRSPHFVASLFSIGKSDLLQTVPRRLAIPLLASADLVMHDLPFKLRPMVLSQMWHARNNNNATHRWLREQVRQAAFSVAGASDGAHKRTV